jgi:two-component system chemotaxis response regulator CheB
LSKSPSKGTSKIVVMGTSAGGLRALENVLGGLPATFGLPIVIVQHRSKESDAFAEVLSNLVKIPVREAEDKDPLVTPGVYVGPPDYHLMVEPGRLALSTDEPVNFSRPSIDVMFESAADAYGAGVVAVLLTGANADGTRGLLRIRSVGGYAVVQDPATAESVEMPGSAIKEGAVDKVIPLDDISKELIRIAPARVRGSRVQREDSPKGTL